MSKMVEKIEEKLHMGGRGQVNNEEAARHQGYVENPHAYDGAGAHGYGAGQAQPLRPTAGSEHVGGLYGTGAHGSHEQVPLKVSATPAGAAGSTGYVYGQPDDYYTQPPRQQHEGPIEKMKNKIKGGQKDGQDHHSSSSSSESDGEGGRRKKKHGLF